MWEVTRESNFYLLWYSWNIFKKFSHYLQEIKFCWKYSTCLGGGSSSIFTLCSLLNLLTRDLASPSSVRKLVLGRVDTGGFWGQIHLWHFGILVRWFWPSFYCVNMRYNNACFIGSLLGFHDILEELGHRVRNLIVLSISLQSRIRVRRWVYLTMFFLWLIQGCLGASQLTVRTDPSHERAWHPWIVVIVHDCILKAVCASLFSALSLANIFLGILFY